MDAVIGIGSTCWLVQPDSWCGDTYPAKTTFINNVVVVSHAHYAILQVVSVQTSVCGSCKTAGGVR
jgi:hypothetical protein